MADAEVRGVERQGPPGEFVATEGRGFHRGRSGPRNDRRTRRIALRENLWGVGVAADEGDRAGAGTERGRRRRVQAAGASVGMDGRTRVISGALNRGLRRHAPGCARTTGRTRGARGPASGTEGRIFRLGIPKVRPEAALEQDDPASWAGMPRGHADWRGSAAPPGADPWARGRCWQRGRRSPGHRAHETVGEAGR